MLRQPTFKCQTGGNVLAKSLKYTPVTQRLLCLIFLMYVASMHCLNYSGLDSTQQFAVYGSDIPVTWKLSQVV